MVKKEDGAGFIASISDRVRREQARAELLDRQPDESWALGDDELLAIASDLVAWGSHPAARKVIHALRGRTDRFEEDLGKLEFAITGLENSAAIYNTKFLTVALEIVEDREASPARLLAAADTLVKWGALDEAERAMKVLERIPELRSAVAGMKATSRQLRASGMLDKAVPVGDDVQSPGFNMPREAMLVRGSGPPGTAVVAFTGMARDFWVSLQVFHHLLGPYAEHIVYLADHSSTLFLNGLPSVAPDYRQMLGFLRRELSKLGIRRTHVVAASAGGFVGLRTAADLPAVGFLGFSIKSDFSGRSPISGYEAEACRKCADASVLIDLVPYLKARLSPLRAIVHASRHFEIDRVHASHLTSVPRFDVRLIDDDRHDTVMILMQRGEFRPLLEEFFGRRASAPDANV